MREGAQRPVIEVCILYIAYLYVDMLGVFTYYLLRSIIYQLIYVL